MKQKNKKRKTIELSRVVALVCALVIPILYMITIILFLLKNSYGSLFLAISMGTSFVLLPAMYAVTKFPKDMAEIYGNTFDMVEVERDSKKNFDLKLRKK